MYTENHSFLWYCVSLSLKGVWIHRFSGARLKSDVASAHQRDPLVPHACTRLTMQECSYGCWEFNNRTVMIFQYSTFYLQRSSSSLVLLCLSHQLGRLCFLKTHPLEGKLCSYCKITHLVCHRFLILFLLFELSVGQFVTDFPADQNVMRITLQSEGSTKFRQDRHRSHICRL